MEVLIRMKISKYTLLFFALLILFADEIKAQDTAINYYTKYWDSASVISYYFVTQEFPLNDSTNVFNTNYRNGGKQMTGHYSVKDTLRQGRFVWFTESGDTTFIKDYINGLEWGLYVRFDKGKRYEVTNKVQGVLNGPAVYYYSNGSISSHGTYNSQGRITGNWKTFDPEGNLIESFDADEIPNE